MFNTAMILGHFVFAIVLGAEALISFRKGKRAEAFILLGIADLILLVFMIFDRN